MVRRLIAAVLFMCVVFVSFCVEARETGRITVTAVGGQSTTMFFEHSEVVGNDLGCPLTRVIVGITDADALKRLSAALVTALQLERKCASQFLSVLDSIQT